MAHIYVDRTDDGQISVRIYAGVSKPKTKLFADRDEAVAFAESKIGRSGMVFDTTLMTAEQLAAHKARQARAESLLKISGRAGGLKTYRAVATPPQGSRVNARPA